MNACERLREYETWYKQTYLPEHLIEEQELDMEDIKNSGWGEPLAALKPLSATALAGLEGQWGPLPAEYRDSVSEIGVGQILCAYDEEPVPFHVLGPSEMERAKSDAISWLSKSDEAIVRDKLGLDPGKMMPIWTDDGRGYYFFMALQEPGDDRVYLFDHAYETGYPLGGPKSFSEFVGRWIECAKKLEPLNPFDGL